MAQAASSPRELLNLLMTADTAGDLEFVLRLYADDAVWLPPNEEMVRGKKAIRERYARSFATTRMTVRFEAEHEAADHDIGYIIGRTIGARSSNDGGTKEDLANKFVMLLKRQGNGWLISSLMWSPNR